jgi:hypothetical protein
MNSPARIYEMPKRRAIPHEAPDRPGPGAVVVSISRRAIRK